MGQNSRFAGNFGLHPARAGGDFSIKKEKKYHAAPSGAAEITAGEAALSDRN
jgi:hypothetical protein